MDFSALRFDARRDDPKRVAAAFAVSEVIVLENAYERGALKQLGAITERFFATLEAKAERSQMEDGFVFNGSAGARSIDDVLYDGETTFTELTCAFAAKQPIARFLRALLQTDNPAFLHSSAGVRRKIPSVAQSLLPFHQDAAHWKGLDDRPLAITAFTPFNPAGREYPGLDVIARKMDAVLPLAEAGRAAYHMDETMLSAHDLAHLWSPHVPVGGAILLSGRTPHRSQHSLKNTRTRFSMDLRFVDAIEPPAFYRDKWMFDLTKGRYSRHEGTERIYQDLRTKPALAPETLTDRLRSLVGA